MCRLKCLRRKICCVYPPLKSSTTGWKIPHFFPDWNECGVHWPRLRWTGWTKWIRRKNCTPSSSSNRCPPFMSFNGLVSLVPFEWLFDIIGHYWLINKELKFHTILAMIYLRQNLDQIYCPLELETAHRICDYNRDISYQYVPWLWNLTTQSNHHSARPNPNWGI